MKKTLLFSNIIGDITNEKALEKCRFNKYMEDYLKKNITQNSNLIFINAPGLGYEDNYLPSIINCFKKIDITFDNICNIDNENSLIDKDIINWNNKVYFLMGGNPIRQYEIIKKHELEIDIKNYNGLVIGFCAGTINLSKYSIITTDEDFKESSSYLGIGRVDLCIEPHYNEDNVDKNRINELFMFSKKYNTKILCIPDESIIIVEDDSVINKGVIHYIDNLN